MASRQLQLPRWWPIAAILLLAGLARLAAIYAMSGLPYFERQRLDALVYHNAGQQIAAGDWSLGDQVLHMSPAYSYLVGTVYSIFGSSAWPIRLLQLILGVATVWLIYRSAKLLLASRRWALLAAGIAALYGPFLFYGAHLLATTLAVFAHALVFERCLYAMQPDRKIASWAWLGAACGFAALVRPTALLFAVPMTLAWWVATRELSWRRRLLRYAAMAIAGAAMLSPATIRNLVVGGELVLVTDSGGLNLFLGNGPGAQGTFRVPREIPKATNAGTQFSAFNEFAETHVGRGLTSSETNRYFVRVTWRHIKTDVAAWLRLLLEKSWLFWNKREIPNTYDYSFTRTISPFFALPSFQFWLVGPFALLGTLLLMGRWKSREQVLGLFILTEMMGLVLFFVISRYRLAAMPLVILASVYGLRFVVDGVRQRRRWTTAAAAAVIVLAIPITFASKLPKTFDDEYFRLGYAHQLAGDSDEAEAAYLEAIAINQDHVSAHKNLAHLYLREGQTLKAQKEWQIVGALGYRLKKPGYVAQAQRALAVWGLTLDQPDEEMRD